ncbi:unnamed protein product [Mycena citricolor]|uniref:Zn(2)-C6 fungal-type domain-containing protein n=1 Tax=Mycena citricolor TaxID=2018698 RepID=A0AAD2HL39_9AGAR|nr:unnamed protein product [Mycena citricolor]
MHRGSRTPGTQFGNIVLRSDLSHELFAGNTQYAPLSSIRTSREVLTSLERSPATGMASSSAQPAPVSQAQRVALACTRCRKRKIRCITPNANTPCQRCERSSLTCEYVPIESNPRPIRWQPPTTPEDYPASDAQRHSMAGLAPIPRQTAQAAGSGRPQISARDGDMQQLLAAQGSSQAVPDPAHQTDTYHPYPNYTGYTMPTSYMAENFNGNAQYSVPGYYGMPIPQEVFFQDPRRDFQGGAGATEDQSAQYPYAAQDYYDLTRGGYYNHMP